MQPRTEVLNGLGEVTRGVLQFINESDKQLSVFANSTGPSVTMSLDAYVKAYTAFKDHGGKIRYLTRVTKDNISDCKKLMALGEVRHLDAIEGDAFAVNETSYIATANMKKGKPMIYCLRTYEAAIVRQMQYVYENLWNQSIPAQEKISEIEDGVSLERTESLSSAANIAKRYVDAVKNASSEIQLIFPSPNALLREEKMGILQEIKAKARNGIKTRVIIGAVRALVDRMLDLEPAGIDVRLIPPQTGPLFTLLIVDRKERLLIEAADDTRLEFGAAVKGANYSNNLQVVLPFTTIFETLWRETEVSQQLRAQRKMESDFINMVAHELRTPITPILGIVEDVLSRDDGKSNTINARKDDCEIVYRNAQRIGQLTGVILDIAAIEAGWLPLRRERFDLRNVIGLVIEEYRKKIKGNVALRKRISNIWYKKPKKMIIVDADRARITQVISNLLDNAIKFTETGSISISTRLKNDTIEISIRDHGIGLAKEHFSRLFTKFDVFAHPDIALKGPGVGLFICKNIIEAHKGKIWAARNPDGKGATFTFSLPLSKKR